MSRERYRSLQDQYPFPIFSNEYILKNMGEQLRFSDACPQDILVPTQYKNRPEMDLFLYCAGAENRTRTYCLEGSHSTTKLRPQCPSIYHNSFLFSNTITLFSREIQKYQNHLSSRVFYFFRNHISHTDA